MKDKTYVDDNVYAIFRAADNEMRRLVNNTRQPAIAQLRQLYLVSTSTAGAALRDRTVIGL